MNNHHFALLPYPKKPYITECFPSKIYEYLACEIPMLLTDHEPWVNYCDQYKACISINFKEYDLEKINEKLEGNFYENKPGNEIFWQSEEANFLGTITDLH